MMAFAQFARIGIKQVRELYGSDGKHPSKRGRYLTSLTILGSLVDELPIWLWYPGTLEGGLDRYYKLTVRRTLFGTESRQWDWGGE